MIQFYSPDIKDTNTLGPEESLHCAKVLRKKRGDLIYVTDGKGTRYECRIISANSRSVEVEILSEEKIPKGWNFELTLAVAPTKNADRMAWLVEKATEIGVDRILFLQCRHSERKTVNIDRLRRNAISAMNQSLKTLLPAIEGMVSPRELTIAGGKGVFGYCDRETKRRAFTGVYKGEEDITIVIGPEGDFSKEEVELLTEKGFAAVTFGEERLRTETAALYGVTAAHVISEIKRKDYE